MEFILSRSVEHLLCQTQTMRSVAAESVMNIFHDEKIHTDWLCIVGYLYVEVHDEGLARVVGLMKPLNGIVYMSVCCSWQSLVSHCLLIMLYEQLTYRVNAIWDEHFFGLEEEGWIVESGGTKPAFCPRFPFRGTVVCRLIIMEYAIEDIVGWIHVA